MKMRSCFVMALAMGVGASAYAGDSFVVPPGTTHLSLIQRDQVSVRANPPQSPRGMRERVASIKVVFELRGCVDTLGPVTVSKVQRGEKLTFFVTAFNVHNPKSQVARCSKLPTASHDIPVAGLGTVDLKNVKVVVAEELLGADILTRSVSEEGETASLQEELSDPANWAQIEKSE